MCQLSEKHVLSLLKHILYSDPKIGFYIMSCRKTIQKDAKLYLNEKGLPETDIYKAQHPL